MDEIIRWFRQMRKIFLSCILFVFCTSPAANAQQRALNPQVKRVVEEVSEDRIAEILKRLEEFRYPQRLFRHR